MRKFIVGIVLAAFVSVVSLPSAYADYAPAEGLYIGAFVGHGAGNVKAKVDIDGTLDAKNDSVTAEIKDGGIGLEGIEYGAIVGYGYKMGDLYAGMEFDYADGGAEFKITTSRDVTLGSRFPDGGDRGDALTANSMSAETEFSVGGGARIGYYLNKDTLFAIKGGIGAAKIEVKAGTLSEKYWTGGPRMGFAMDSRLAAVDPNLNLRLEWDYTDYMTSPISGIGTEKSGNGQYNSEVTGAAYQARIGFTYSFFDVTSLF